MKKLNFLASPVGMAQCSLLALGLSGAGATDKNKTTDNVNMIDGVMVDGMMVGDDESN